MLRVRGRVTAGRLRVDVETDLPEGEVALELVDLADTGEAEWPAELDAELACTIVDAENFLEWGLAFEDSDGLRTQFRFGAENGFDGKIRNEDAGERHGKPVVGRWREAASY